MSTEAPHFTETPFFLRLRGADIFGLLTTPAGPSTGAAAVLLSAFEAVPTIGVTRYQVRLARRLAASGLHALRFDYSGCGESTGPLSPTRLEDAILGPMADDVESMVGWLRDRGLDRIAVVGQCLGSRLALRCAGRLPGLAALGLSSAPVYNYAYNRTTTREGRISDFMRDLRTTIDARVPALLLYGRDDDFHEDFEDARDGELGRLLATAADLVEVRVVDPPIHGHVNAAGQELLIDTFDDWLRRILSA